MGDAYWLIVVIMQKILVISSLFSLFCQTEAMLSCQQRQPSEGKVSLITIRDLSDKSSGAKDSYNINITGPLSLKIMDKVDGFIETSETKIRLLRIGRSELLNQQIIEWIAKLLNCPKILYVIFPKKYERPVQACLLQISTPSKLFRQQEQFSIKNVPITKIEYLCKTTSRDILTTTIEIFSKQSITGDHFSINIIGHLFPEVMNEVDDLIETSGTTIDLLNICRGKQYDQQATEWIAKLVSHPKVLCVSFPQIYKQQILAFLYKLHLRVISLQKSLRTACL